MITAEGSGERRAESLCLMGSFPVGADKKPLRTDRGDGGTRI